MALNFSVFTSLSCRISFWIRSGIRSTPFWWSSVALSIPSRRASKRSRRVPIARAIVSSLSLLDRGWGVHRTLACCLCCLYCVVSWAGSSSLVVLFFRSLQLSASRSVGCSCDDAYDSRLRGAGPTRRAVHRASEQVFVRVRASRRGDKLAAMILADGFRRQSRARQPQVGLWLLASSAGRLYRWELQS